MSGFAIAEQELDAGVVCLELTGELDAGNAYDFDERVRSVEARSVTTLVLDLRAVSFVDSAGLARIIAAGRRANANGHRLAVVRGCRAVERLFALTAMDTALDMVAEPQAVL